MVFDASKPLIPEAKRAMFVDQVAAFSADYSLAYPVTYHTTIKSKEESSLATERNLLDIFAEKAGLDKMSPDITMQMRAHPFYPFLLDVVSGVKMRTILFPTTDLGIRGMEMMSETEDVVKNDPKYLAKILLLDMTLGKMSQDADTNKQLVNIGENIMTVRGKARRPSALDNSRLAESHEQLTTLLKGPIEKTLSQLPQDSTFAIKDLLTALL